jgi:PAS domain S-box-containing protein
MDSEPSLAFRLNQSIARLGQLIDTARDIFMRYGNLPPTQYMEDLSHLKHNLAQISEQLTLLEKHRDDLLALIETGQVINSSLNPDEVLRVVMDTMIRLLKAERGFLMLKDRNGSLRMRIARNWEQESVHPSEFSISHTVVNRVISESKPILTTNAQEDPRFGGQESVIAYQLRSILCIPLKVKDELTGVIYADNRIRSGIFTEHELELLTAFANQAAVAIENARLFESLRRTLSEVTGLKNLMDNIFASIASGVITADIEERITLCNRAAENILGCSQTDLVGHNLVEAVPDLSPSMEQHIKSVRLTDQNIVGIEFNSSLPRRGPVSLTFNFSPLKDASQTTQGVAIVLDDQTEKKRLEAQRRLFERMVSPAVIDQLDPNQLQLGGKRTDITTLFADIRDFTPFSESQPPERLVSVLNRYLAAAAEAILDQQGTIDKFLGDAVMAWFNAPIPLPDHALKAVQAALAIRSAIERLHLELPPEYRLSFGVGIHYGEAVLGLIGTDKRLEYTAIGDSVNTAKRIQENAHPGQILISAPVYYLVAGKVDARLIEPLTAKGKSLPVIVYNVIGMKPPTR